MAQNFYDMNDQELLQAKVALKRDIDRQKKEMEELNSLLQARFFSEARDELQRDGKDFGTTTIFSEQDQKVKVAINKKVTWDQQALRDAFDSMDAEDARHYAKVTYSVDERKYTNAPPAIVAKLQPARTVEQGTVNIDLVQTEEA
jgi:ABC-type sugar transport system ATPase subunit|tara:strand:+ start:56 stop:490 length:435 start_codon:yes stop_codon:yes gene_type:complete